jgi:hypothetical protein
MLDLTRYYLQNKFVSTRKAFLSRWEDIAGKIPFPPDATLVDWSKKHAAGLPSKAAHGGYRPVLMTLQEQNTLLLLLRSIRENGLRLNWQVTQRHARAILLQRNVNRLPGKSWCKKFNFMNSFRRRRATKAARKTLSALDEVIEKRFFHQVAFLVQQHRIPKGLVMNFDETGLLLAHFGNVTLEIEGSIQVRVLGHDDKRQVTGVTATAADSVALPVGLIFNGQEKSRRAIPKVADLNDMWTYQTPSHWMTQTALLSYYRSVIRSFVKRRREELGLPPNQPALLLLDTYSTHLCQSLRNLAQIDGVLIVFIPPGFTDRLQPQDLAINNPFKKHVSDILSTYFEAGLQAAQQAGKVVQWEKELQKSKIGVPFVKAVATAWKWVSSDDERAVAIRRNAFAKFMICWEADFQAEALAANSVDGGLFQASGKQRGLPLIELLETVVELDAADDEQIDSDDVADQMSGDALNAEAEEIGDEDGDEEEPSDESDGEGNDDPDLVAVEGNGDDDDNDDGDDIGDDDDDVPQLLRRRDSGTLVAQMNALAEAERIRRERNKQRKQKK